MRTRALLSAHRAAARQSGHRDNSWESLEEAVRLPVEYVEFDVHRTADGVFVLHHDDRVRGCDGRRHPIKERTYAELGSVAAYQLPRYSAALDLLHAYGKLAHIDFKFASPRGALGVPHEVEAAEIALDVMGAASSFILTTTEDHSVRILRDWADRRAPETLVGLSFGLVHWRPAHGPLLRLPELFPGRRLERCGANLVVSEHRLADVRLLAWAHRRNLPVLVWTVDEPRKLRRLLDDRRVWMVTTNHPSRAHTAPLAVPAPQAS